LDWNPARGSEQAGLRPALIVQTDAANQNPAYPNTIVATMSTAGRQIPTHVEVLPSNENGLRELSYVKCEQLLTVSKGRLRDRIGALSPGLMANVDVAIKRVLFLS